MVAIEIPNDSRPGVLRRPAPQPARRARVSAPSARPAFASRPASGTAPHRRAAGAGCFALALAACAVWAQAGIGGAGGRPGNGPLAVPGAGPAQVAAAHVWVVHPGDTVWAIARALQPGGDIRPLVDRLSRELHGAPLEVGQQLQIP